MPSPSANPPPDARPVLPVASLDEMLPLVYAELRSRAAAYLRGERPDHTLQPTALVHEAYLRLTRQRDVDWGNRDQFLGVAAQMMRRILVNHAVARGREKRGSGVMKLELDQALDLCDERQVSLCEMDDALTKLETMDPRLGKVVELRFYGGLTVEEVARVLQTSPATVKRDWTVAKAWLRRAVAGQE